MIRRYQIVAIQVPIMYNRYGDCDPKGLMFVLEENEAMVRLSAGEYDTSSVEKVQPLVIRACQGEVVELIFTNKLEYAISVDFNELTKHVLPGTSVVYTLHAAVQGAHLYRGVYCADPLESMEYKYGLFGALIVEPPSTTWSHPETSENLESGFAADIHSPFLPDFREFVVFFHGEVSIKDKFGNIPVNPLTGLPDSTFAINYRSEPFRNRLRFLESGKANGVGAEVYYDSWVFGDPATPVFRAYKGDPVRFYVINMSTDQSHAFYLHGHRCYLSKQGVNLPDTIFVEPLQVVVLDLMHGAGGLRNAYGDFLFHCCLYTHCQDGAWGILRVLDVLEEGGNRFYPDGTRISPLIPLPDKAFPLRPTSKRPGFPLFIPGTFGGRAPLPPYSFGRKFGITDLERCALSHNIWKKHLCTHQTSDTPIRRIDIVAIETPICYNREKWFDPEGRVFVLAEDEKLIRSGKKSLEPLFIRANAGECIEIRLINKLPCTIGGTPFQVLEETPYCSLHVRGLSLDVLTSDGTNCGWNYFCGVAAGGQGIYRWYTTSTTTALFYDHLFMGHHQNHGLFGALVVESHGSEYSCPFTGKLLPSGSQAVIENYYLPSFREYCVIMNKFAPVFDRRMRCVNPPAVPGQLEEAGTIAYNYRNEPLSLRQGDPAYVLSSWVHGDPETPVFQGYAGDPVKFHYVSFQDSNPIDISGQPYLQSEDMFFCQTGVESVCTSTTRCFEFALGSNGTDDFDVLYRSRSLQDFIDGLWGLIRVRGRRVPFLKTLSGREPLPYRVMPLPVPTGRPPRRALSPGKSVSDNVQVRKHHVAAIQHPVRYNFYEDHDPFAILFVPVDRLDDVFRGRYNPEPLIIRANVGDCIELTLTNLLPPTMPRYLSSLKTDTLSSQYGPRISLHAGGLKYDVLGSDGATVGFNPDQTIAPGETRTYRWYVDELPHGGIGLFDYGNVFHHVYHGLFGALIVQPRGSYWQDLQVQGRTQSGTEVDVLNPFMPSVREVVLLHHDCDFLMDREGMLISHLKSIGNGSMRKSFRARDCGVRAINYRTEPWLDYLSKRNVPLVSWNDTKTFISQAYSTNSVVVRWLEVSPSFRSKTYYVTK